MADSLYELAKDLARLQDQVPVYNVEHWRWELRPIGWAGDISSAPHPIATMLSNCKDNDKVIVYPDGHVERWEGDATGRLPDAPAGDGVDDHQDAETRHGEPTTERPDRANQSGLD